jgi:hypothetical protein
MNVWTKVLTFHIPLLHLFIGDVNNSQPCCLTGLQSSVELDNCHVQFSHRKLLRDVLLVCKASSSSPNLQCHHLLLKTGLAPVSDAKHFVACHGDWSRFQYDSLIAKIVLKAAKSLAETF